MNRIIRILSLATVVTSSLALAEAASPRAFMIAEQGKAACSIVIADKPTPSVRLAALELQSHILSIAGAELTIRPESQSASGPRILVGESSATRDLGYRSADFGPQEYFIGVRPDTIILIGRDWEDTDFNRKIQGRSTTDESLQQARHTIDYWRAVGRPERSTGSMELPGLYDDQGTCLATYDFLERFCGVRWYGPAVVNVVTPSRPTLTVAGGEVRRSPALKHRAALMGGSWPFLSGQWGEFTREQVQLLWRRSRQGGERWAGNHTFHRSTINAWFTDPDYQCQNPKGLGSQLCYTNRKLVDQVAQMARDYFDGRGQLPEGWKASGDYFAIVPDDNVNLCKCGPCQALLEPGRSRKTGFFSGGEMSDYWFSFVNAVARDVGRTHPTKYIATLAYWSYALPPSFELEPNVSVAPCLHTCYYPVHPEMRENDLKLYKAWQAKTKAPMFLWVYYHHPMEAGLIGKWKCFPHVMVHDTARSMKLFIKDGVRGIFECGEQDQVEQYVMAKVWDDPAVDVDAILNEFFLGYFGPAAEPMKRFYRSLEQIACDPANYPEPYHRRDGINWKTVAWERLGTADRVDELGALMAAAEKQAETPAEKQRVALWRKAFWDWIRQGREGYTAAQKGK